jgi:hypothetical protein
MGAGTAMALGTPASRALPPTLVSADLLENAMTLRGVAMYASGVLGPALGGLLYLYSPGLVYGVAGAMCLAAAASVAAMSHRPGPEPPRGSSATSWHSVMAGIRFVRRTEIVLGAILLDLLVVLFGGAIALRVRSTAPASAPTAGAARRKAPATTSSFCCRCSPTRS